MTVMTFGKLTAWNNLSLITSHCVFGWITTTSMLGRPRFFFVCLLLTIMPEILWLHALTDAASVTESFYF